MITRHPSNLARSNLARERIEHALLMMMLRGRFFHAGWRLAVGSEDAYTQDDPLATTLLLCELAPGEKVPKGMDYILGW